MRKMLTSMLVVSSVATYAQTRQISGQILDQDTKEPLAGATVFISPNEKGVSDFNPQGVIADYDGNFTFTLPASVKQVVVSFLGYEAQTVEVSKKQSFHIFLAPAVNELQDIVVTGYQKIEKRKVTSAISKVDVSEIKQVGVASVDQLLEGQISGMVSTPANGGPGSPTRIRIRGTASLNGTQDPLWVVDGMPLEGNEVGTDFGNKDNIDNLSNTSIAGLNPDDIADITILKDAAATAIYGARAANGVIVVTTKKGKQGKMKINFNAATFITMKPDFDKLNLMNASEKVDFELYLAGRSDLNFRKEKGDVARILNANGDYSSFQNGGWDAISDASRSRINALRSSGDNWFDQVYRTAVNQQYGLSLSGGSDIATYYVSAGYYDEQGTTQGTGFNRLNLSSNIDFKITDKINFGIGLFGNQSKRESYISDTDAHSNPGKYTRTVNPYRSVYDENGNYAYDQDIDGYSDRYVPFNYAEEMANTNYELKNTSIKALFTLDYNIIKGLKLHSQFGLQVDKTGTEKFAGKDTYFSRKYKERSRYSLGGGKFGYFVPEGGIIQNWNDDFFQYNWKVQGEFSRTVAEKHDFDLMAGVELRANETTNIHTKGFGFDEKTLTTIPIVFPNDNYAKESIYRQYVKSVNENAFASYYGTASYTYDNRYTAFGSIRFDGSNLFGVDPKYRYLPLWSISGAWNINREEFLRDVRWLSNLKLRASYGLQGNIDKNTSPFVLGEWNNSSILPGVSEPTINVTSPPNQKLRWEKTGTTNVGLDFGIFNNRLTGSVEGYYRKSTDLIGLHALAQENGFEYTQMNWASVTNKGFEVSLSSRNIVTRDFTWSTDFNLSMNKSLVNKINVRENSYEPSREGYAVNAVFVLKTAGLDENGIPQFKNKAGEVVSYKEFFKLKTEDFWGQTMVTSSLTPSEYRDLFEYAGDADPKFSGGFVNKFRYKDFDLAISTSFNLKQMVRATPSYYATEIDPGMNYTKEVLNAWSSDNQNSLLPGIIGSGDKSIEAEYIWMNGMDPGNSYRMLDTWVKEISYVRINSIRLGYTIPAKVLKGKFIESCRLNAEARNPFVFGTNYNGYFDPETYGNIYAQPISKSFSVGVNMTF
ncbi:MAG: SusC/RagA family TonB-linked outer membrane protein [Bacteroidales bacterium]